MTDLERTTERLLLRPVQEWDAAPTAALMTPDVAANLTSWPSPMAPEMALERIRLAHDALAARQALDLAVCDRESEALLGWISVGIPPLATDQGEARIGFWLGRRHQGRGLMTEAAQAVIPMAVDVLSIGTIDACVYPRNATSAAIVRKLGFQPHGCVQLYSPVRGRNEEALLFRQHVLAPSLARVARP